MATDSDEAPRLGEALSDDDGHHDNNADQTNESSGQTEERLRLRRQEDAASLAHERAVREPQLSNELAEMLASAQEPTDEFIEECARLGSVKLIEELLATELDVTRGEGVLCEHVLLEAVENNHADLVRLLVHKDRERLKTALERYGRDSEHTNQIDGHHINLHWALRTAAEFGSLETARVLLEEGAEVQGQWSWDAFDQTPLADAIEEDRREMARFLVEKGANPGGLPEEYQDLPFVAELARLYEETAASRIAPPPPPVAATE